MTSKINNIIKIIKNIIIYKMKKKNLINILIKYNDIIIFY